MVHDGDGEGLALANAERQSASALIDIAAKVKAGDEHCKRVDCSIIAPVTAPNS
jgi:hypothetical protein